MVERCILSSSSPTDRGIVDEICDTNPNATIYQTKYWWDLQEQVFGYRTFYIHVRSDSRYCLLPLSGVRGIPTTSRLTCLPLTQFCGPLYTDSEMLHEAISSAISLRVEKGYSALVIKPKTELPESVHAHLEARGYYKDYWIDFRERKLDAIWNQLADGEKRRVRKAEKASIVVDDNPGEQDIAELNSIMLQTTKRHNVPAYPKTLLRFIKDDMREQARIYVSKLDGMVIAGIVVLSFGSSSVYAYGFGLPQYFNTGSVPLLFWRAMVDGYNEGRECLDLGIASPTDEGLSSFKSRLGSNCRELPFYFEGARFEELVFDPNSSARFLSKLYNVMPMSLHAVVGPHIVSRLG